MKRVWMCVAAGAGGILGVKLLGGHRMSSDEICEIRCKKIKEAAMKKSAYLGVKRSQEAQTVLEKLKDGVVVLYSPTISGKSQLAAYIQDTYPHPAIRIEGKGSEEATFQQFDPEPPYPAGDLIEFQFAAVSTLFAVANPLLIIDSPERMPIAIGERFIQRAYSLKRDSITDALVVTNSVEMVEIAQTRGDVQIHELSDPSREEYLAIATRLGMDTNTAEALYRQWGGSLEILLKTKEHPNYAETLQTTYIRELRTILESNPDLKQPFQEIYETVTSLTPLGNTYIDIEAAQILHKTGVMVAYPNEALRFRSQIAVSALHKALNPS